MQGNQQVIEVLKQLLAGELAARDQYFAHSRLCADWGLDKLAEHYEHERQEEAAHADAILKRLLFLEAIPDMNQHALIDLGTDVVSMLKHDLQLEYQVQAALKAAIQICETQQDYVSRELLRVQLSDTEEDHAYWLEKQLGLIDKIGLPNYLQSQI